MAKQTPLQKKVQELQLRALRSRQVEMSRSGEVPYKKHTKGLPKLQNTFAKNLARVPGGGIVGMIAAPKTGCRTRKEGIGVLASARNSNTTSGSYVTTVVWEDDRKVSDAQGRKEFGR